VYAVVRQDVEEDRWSLPRVVGGKAAEAFRLTRAACLALVLVASAASSTARADAWLAVRMDMGKQADVALALFPGLRAAFARCDVDAARDVDRVELAVAEAGRVRLDVHGRVAAHKLACVLGRDLGGEGDLAARGGPRVHAVKGGLHVASPTGD